MDFVKFYIIFYTFHCARASSELSDCTNDRIDGSRVQSIIAPVHDLRNIISNIKTIARNFCCRRENNVLPFAKEDAATIIMI